MLERFEPGPQSESEAQPKVALADALRESEGAGLVFKPNLDNIAGEIKLRLPELDAETKDKLEKYKGGSRLLGHLFRLLSPERSETEHDFAKVMLGHYQELKDERKALLDDEEAMTELFEAQSKIEDINDYMMAFYALHQVPEGDCADTVMWWTFSPYVARELHEKGVDDKAILERLMAWALPAAEKGSDEPNVVHLPGLDFLKGTDGRDRTYILSTNPEGTSHKFTAQKARELVNGLVV